MTFDFPNYTRTIASMGCEITMEALGGSRELIAPHLECSPFKDVTIGRDIRYGERERHRLDLFTAPESSDQPRPVIVYIHGGGFISGGKYAPGTPFFDNVGAWAVRNGFNAINMTYRLAPESTWPSGVEDIRLVMNFIQQHGAEHGINPQQVFLIGHSAGACHAASYVTHPDIYAPKPHGVAGLILLSGMYDFTAYTLSEKETSYLGTDASVYAECSSLAGLTETDVPLLVAMAEHDPALFMEQGLSLLQARFKRHATLPKTVYMTGQNHLSGILCLGLPGDVLGPQLKHFVEANTAG